MKLIIQIPCYNEEKTLPATIADLPRKVDGIDSIEVLIIDDGSTDSTAAVAKELGVHHVVRLATNSGLSEAYMTGLDACLRLGADIVVNTDADNQYRGSDIAQLVLPVVEGSADIAIGDRGVDSLKQFSWGKRLLQSWGSSLVRRASGVQVIDSTSGFRAMNRKTILRSFTHNRFSYTLETIIQAGCLGLRIVNVPVAINDVTRPSRLFKSIPDYLRRNGPVIFRAYGMYWPGQTFGLLGVLLFFLGAGLIGRFLYFYLSNPEVSSHIQSLQIGVGLVVLAFVVGLMAYLGELIAANRRLSQEILGRIRRIDAEFARANLRERSESPEGIESTAAPPWRRP